MLVTLLACTPTPVTSPVPIDTGSAPTVDDVGPSWTADIQPLVARHCIGCHSDGGVAPMPFDTYDEAFPWAAAIAASTSDRRMPPYLPVTSPECRSFTRSPALTDPDIATLAAWVANGAPEGDPTIEAVPAPSPARLLREDVTLVLPAPYTPDAAVDDDYRCFLLDPGQAIDRFRTGFEVVPGVPAAIHHVLVAILRSDAALAAAEALDTPTSGWDCTEGFGFSGAVTVALSPPGSGAQMFPAGTGVQLPSRPLVVQIHYNTLRGVDADDTVIHLMLEDGVADPAWLQPTMALDFVLSPGRPSITVVDETWILQPLRLFGVAPHMHTLGRSIRADVVHADGSEACLVHVDRWDSHWQEFYYYEAPVELVPGDRMRVTCEWSTLGAASPVIEGMAATDEMCMVPAYVVGAR